jgi:hypothetical protein
MLDKVTDTTVRAVLYEAAGTVDAQALQRGAAEVARARELNEISGALLEVDPRDQEPWVGAARAGIERLLAAERAR